MHGSHRNQIVRMPCVLYDSGLATCDYHYCLCSRGDGVWYLSIQFVFNVYLFHYLLLCAQHIAKGKSPSNRRKNKRILLWPSWEDLSLNCSAKEHEDEPLWLNKVCHARLWKCLFGLCVLVDCQRSLAEAVSQTAAACIKETHSQVRQRASNLSPRAGRVEASLVAS